jgi:hypothetical protein
MNERIEKLGEQADLLGECTPTKIPGRYVGYITEEQILKFAELIIRQCGCYADIFAALGCPECMDPIETKPSDYIKNKFGVE